MLSPDIPKGWEGHEDLYQGFFSQEPKKPIDTKPTPEHQPSEPPSMTMVRRILDERVQTDYIKKEPVWLEIFGIRRPIGPLSFLYAEGERILTNERYILPENFSDKTSGEDRTFSILNDGGAEVHTLADDGMVGQKLRNVKPIPADEVREHPLLRKAIAYRPLKRS